MTKRLFLTTFLLAAAVSCTKQEHPVPSVESQETLIIANDISNQKVTSFMEDSQGHIWISTFRGLNRFNVHEYHQHFCTSDEMTLPDNQVQCLYNDSKNRLWVSTVNGMALHTEQDNFIRIPMPTRSRNTVQIVEDELGRIFINTMVDISVYNEDTGQFENVLNSVDGNMPAATQIFFSPTDNDLWVASPTHFNRYDSKDFSHKESIPLNNIYSYFSILEDGTVWMSSENGISLYNIPQHCFIEVPDALNKHKTFGKSHVTYIYPYKDDSLLLYTEKQGMYIYNRVENNLKHQSE